MIDRNDIANYVKRFTFVSNDGTIHSLFDLVWPIGITYVQYPQQASPMDLWGTFSTWEVVNYDGAFFRAEGTNANAFIEKTGNLIKQDDQNKSHFHLFEPKGHVSFFSMGVVARWRDRQGGDWGLKVKELFRHGDFGGGGGEGGIYDEISYFPDFTGIISKSERSGGNEARPQNYTIRIWKRTA